MPIFMFGSAQMLILACAAAAPIIIHLMVREKPKLIVFPAVRFLQARATKRLRNLRFKHLLLMLLRVLLLIGLAAAMAQPTLKGGCVRGGGAGSVVVIIDDSLSMLALSGGKTGFARAKEKAERFIRRLSHGSHIGVVTTSSPGVVFASEKSEAIGKLKGLKPAAGAHRAWPAIADAVSALERQKEGGRLVVLFSDMTANAWRGVDSGSGAIAESVKVALVPVSLDDVSNIYFSRARLRQDSLNPGAQAVVEYVVAGGDNDRGGFECVEFFAGGEKLAQSPENSGKFTFKVPGDKKFIQGEMKIICADDLRADNAWRFTVGATSPSRILLARGDDAAESTVLPAVLYAALGAEVEFVSPGKLALMRLGSSDIVVVEGLDVLTNKLLEKLLAFVWKGGGLMVFPDAGFSGEKKLHVDWRLLLPGYVLKKAAARKAMTIDVVNENHPIARAFSEGTFADRNIREPRFRKFVKVATVDEFSQTKIFAYSDGSPALVAKSQGKGNALFFAGALDREWSDLVTHPSVVVLVSEAIKFLSGKSDERFNYSFGEFVSVRLPAEGGAKGLMLRVPGTSRDIAMEKTPRSIAARKSGNYVLYYAADKSHAMAFSANVSPGESQLQALQAEQLKKMLPDCEFTDRPGAGLLDTKTSDAELPIHGAVLVLILLLLSIEQIVANRFYRRVAEDG